MKSVIRHCITIPLFLLSTLLILGCQMKYIVTFTADRTTVAVGEPVTLSWNVQHIEQITLQSVEIDAGIGAVESTGTRTVNPTESTRYRLMATFLDENGTIIEEARNIDITVTGGGTDNPSQALCFCDDDVGMNRIVVNPNSTSRSIGHKTLEALRITMPDKETHSLASIKSATERFAATQEKISRGRLSYHFRSARTLDTNTTDCSVAKDAAERERTKGTFVTIITVPCGPQHASIAQSKVHIQQNIQFIRHHEVGHVLGLNHAGNWLSATNTVESYGDYSSNMSRGGAPGYNVSQLHGLGWTDAHETVRINDYLDKVGYFEGKVRPVENNQPGALPLAYVYELSHNDRRLWISAPYNDKRQIFVHSQRTCKGCSGMYMGTRRLGVINDIGIEHQVGGLAVTLLGTQTNDNGEFTEFTVRIRPGASTYIVQWPFDESEGTPMTKLNSTGIITPAPWTHSPKGSVRTTGQGTLRFRPGESSLKNSSSWFSLNSSANEPNKGKVWVGMDISEFRFAGQANERLRFGLVQDAKSEATLAEFHLLRNAGNSLSLLGYNGKTEAPANGTRIVDNDSFEGHLEIVTEYDFDALTYQIFYRTGNQAAWSVLGAPMPMDAAAKDKNLKTHLRLASTGSFTDSAEEGIEIDRLFVSLKNPMEADHAHAE